MIVLTGGAGFIGSCFLWKLNKENIDDVIIVDFLGEKDKWPNLLGKKFKDYIQKDRFLKLVEEKKIPKPSFVVHMGACSSTTETDANYLIENNFEYSKKLALWCFNNNTPFMYASSAATYGAGEFGYDDTDENTYRLRPLNLYGFSKQLFDLWLLNNNLVSKATGLKFFNVFGPNEYHKEDMRSVICKKFDDVKNGQPMRLFKSYRSDYKDGEQKRDFIYVKDAIEAMWYFFKYFKKTGIFNLGTGVARSWNDVAKALFKALGKETKIEYFDMPENIRPKYQYLTQAKMDNLRSAGCNIKFSSLEDSVKDYSSYLINKSYL
ncbi:MAG: ADP-glyceromanno-heptose 6-epimerase [Elusimicrobia bacterium]|nr:ADP-glyceromanno-heptose 6-epimerase [Elusimicrobiota bacterium]